MNAVTEGTQFASYMRRRYWRAKILNNNLDVSYFPKGSAVRECVCAPTAIIKEPDKIIHSLTKRKRQF